MPKLIKFLALLLETRFQFKELVNMEFMKMEGLSISNHGIYEDGRSIYIECLGQVIPVSYGYYNEGYLKYHVHEFEKPLQQKLNQRLYMLGKVL